MAGPTKKKKFENVEFIFDAPTTLNTEPTKPADPVKESASENKEVRPSNIKKQEEAAIQEAVEKSEIISFTTGKPLDLNEVESDHVAPLSTKASTPEIENVIPEVQPKSVAPARAPRIVISETDEFASESMKQQILNPAEGTDDTHESVTEPVEKPSFMENVRISKTVLPESSKADSSKSPLFRTKEGATGSTTSKTHARSVENATVREYGATDSLNSKPKNTMPTSPTTPLSSYTKNIERQSREQKAVGTLLSGVGLSLLVVVTFVALCAGFGGYVLYKQIRNQSVTIENLQASTDNQLADLNETLVKTREELATTDRLLKAQNEQLITTRQQLAAAQTQVKNDRKFFEEISTKLSVRLHALEGRKDRAN